MKAIYKKEEVRILNFLIGGNEQPWAVILKGSKLDWCPISELEIIEEKKDGLSSEIKQIKSGSGNRKKSRRKKTN